MKVRCPASSPGGEGTGQPNDQPVWWAPAVSKAKELRLVRKRNPLRAVALVALVLALAGLGDALVAQRIAGPHITVSAPPSTRPVVITPAGPGQLAETPGILGTMELKLHQLDLSLGRAFADLASNDRKARK
jgi:hypothetical protein